MTPEAGATIEFELAANETLLVLAGRGELRVNGGEPIELRSGVIVSLDRGYRTHGSSMNSFENSGSTADRVSGLLRLAGYVVFQRATQGRGRNIRLRECSRMHPDVREVEAGPWLPPTHV